MKILVLSPRPPWPPHDGGAVATLRCIEGLFVNGARVSLLAMRTQKHRSDKDTETVTQSSLEDYQAVSVDTRVRPIRMLGNLLLSDKPYDIERFRSHTFLEALRTVIATGDFDIIQCEGLVFAPYLREIRKCTSVPVVLRAHNVEHRIREMMAENSTGRLHRAYLANLARRLRKLETEAAQRFDAIVTVSEPDCKWFSSVSSGRPVRLSATGADVAEFRNEPEGPGLRVGFIGALNWQPNLEGIKWFLAHVWPCVIRTVPSATLHIAGRAAPADARKWLRGKNVFFEGEADDALRFMASVNVIIAPLFAGSGVRIKIIEAMSIGRTVVATPVAVSGLPVENRREIIIATDPGSFCTSLTEVLQDPALRTSTGMAAVALVRQRYNNIALTADLIEFYKELSHDR
ncbi:glycosyltransferase [bacterium]|nr:glycosyltransferase [bacterium]